MNCIHETEHGICEIDNDLCCNGRCRIKEPRNNYDTIRAMSIEEMAEWIFRRDLAVANGLIEATGLGININYDEKVCIESIADMLRNPTEAPDAEA